MSLSASSNQAKCLIRPFMALDADNSIYNEVYRLRKMNTASAKRLR